MPSRMASALKGVRSLWADSDTRRSAALGAAALLLAGVGVLALTLMPEPLKAVPGVAEGSSGLAAYYESAFPTPGDEPLRRPVSVDVCGSRVYVADSVAGVVRVFDERGVPESVIGSGTLAAPAYVACDRRSGRVYVTDRKANALLCFEPGSVIPRRIVPHERDGDATSSPRASAQPATAVAGFSPLGVSVDESGTLYATDVASRHRVLVMEADGTVVSEIGGARAAAEATGVAVVLDFPNDVLVAGDEVWVSDSNNRRVVIFDRAGALIRVARVRGLARGLAAVPGSSGASLTVAGVDALGQTIVLWDRLGRELGRFGEPGSVAGRLQFPNDVAVSSDGDRLYVADTGNRRIQVWRLERGDAGDGAGRPAAADASNRQPYVATALLAFLAAGVSGVVSISSWRRRTSAREALDEARMP